GALTSNCSSAKAFTRSSPGSKTPHLSRRVLRKFLLHNVKRPLSMRPSVLFFRISIRVAERFFSGVPQPPPPWRLLPESFFCQSRFKHRFHQKRGGLRASHAGASLIRLGRGVSSFCLNQFQDHFVFCLWRNMLLAERSKRPFAHFKKSKKSCCNLRALA